MKKIFASGIILASMIALHATAQNNYTPATGNIGINVPTSTTAESPLQIGTGINKISLGTGVGSSEYVINGYLGFNMTRVGALWKLNGDGEFNGGSAITMEQDGTLHFASVPTTTGASQTVGDNDFWYKIQMSMNSSSVSIKNKLVIGMNLNTPAGYKLYVEQGILTEKVKVAVKNTANWADFVFAKNYKLASLVEVEKYIAKNQHLPGIPSAKEVVKEGVDLGQMDAKLLMKVEELTLYTIDQNKEIISLKKENTEILKVMAELKKLIEAKNK